jgi:parallel beta-helix repeat protein
MHTPLAFLRFVAKAALNAVGAGVAGDFAVEFLPELAGDVWKWWGGDNKTPEQMRAEIQEVAQVTPPEAREQAQALVLQVAADQPLAVQKQLSIYLEQVPAAVRQSLRRPADPTGTTVPGTFALKGAEDLVPLLPSRLPRFQPGQRPAGIGDWELEELLGVGGFGEVWKARNPHFPSATPVALKFCVDPTAARLLRHEAAILDRVMSHGRHPGIIELRHTYLGAEPPCLEYEYVAGGDLASVIQAWHRTPTLPQGAGKPHPIVAQATHLFKELVSIVAFAHELNPAIVHRDLKPANILVQRGPTRELTLRVADFGIGAVSARQCISATKMGTTRGQFLFTALRGAHTPLYASPQQQRGDPADPRDDVHALGVIWYQMLTGDLATGRPSGARWRRRLDEQGMSATLLDLLTACIEDDPRDRPESACPLLEMLNRLVPEPRNSGSVPVAPSQTPPYSGPSTPSWTVDPPPSAIPVTAPTGLATIVVSRLGRGQYTSLNAAIKAAQPGTRILVQPGLYTEEIVIDRPLEIVGDGPLADVIIQGQEGNCLQMGTDYALVRGLTFRCRAGSRGKQCYAVDITKGQLVLEGCDVTSDSLACVGVHGSAAEPVIRRCKVHDGKSAGLFFYDNSQGIVEECEIYGNTHAAIAISGGSNPSVRNCKIHDGKQVGVHIYEGAAGTIEDCHIYGHILNGLEIKQKSTPTVRRCKVQDGVLIWDGGLGLLEECDITGNTAPELAVSKQANPTVRRCNIHDSNHVAVLVYDGGLGVFEECTIVGNALHGVEIKTTGNPTVRHCRINRNKNRGIYVHDDGAGSIESCDVTGNVQGAFYIDSNCKVKRNNNRE